MKIICLIKQVPDTEIQPRVKSDFSDIERENLKWVINPYDEYGITEAVKIKELFPDIEIIAISLGNDTVKERIRTALAIGCDKGIHIRVDNDFLLDPMKIAKELSKCIKETGFDIIFTGKKAVDDELGVIGGIVASLLGIPVVYGIISFDLNKDTKIVTCKREFSSGSEIIETTIPVLFTCEKGLNEPKYPSLPAIMKAKKKPIDEILVSDMSSNIVIKKLNIPEIKRSSRKIEGDLSNQVKEVLTIMKEEIKII